MKNKIISTASELFTEKGVERTSLAEIAKKANISKGTLYYHFSSKNELVFAVADMHMSSITSMLTDLLQLGEEPDDVILKLYSIIPKAITRSRLHIYLLREAVTGSDDLLKRFQLTYSDWKQSLIDRLRMFYPDYNDAEIFSRFLIASLDGLVIQELIGINDVSPDNYAGLVTTFLKYN